MWILAIRWSFIFTHSRGLEILDNTSHSSTHWWVRTYQFSGGGVGELEMFYKLYKISRHLSESQACTEWSLPSTNRDMSIVLLPSTSAPQSSFIQLTP